MKKAIRLVFLLTLLFLVQGVRPAKDPTVDITTIPAADLSDLRYGRYGEVDYYKFGTHWAVEYNGKPVKYSTLSPSETKLGFLYESLEQDNSENTSVIIFDTDSRRFNHVFTGDRIGAPEWLGNEHVFFTGYCGTSCQGLYLVDTLNKETRLGVLFYMVLDKARGPYTIFKDWLGKEFEFDGLVKEIKSEISGNNTYLIFEMQDNKGKPAGEKKFLFTGNALEE